MNPQNEREVANARYKLARLEAHYQELQNETAGDEELRHMNRRSVKRIINQLKEEGVRCEIRQGVARSSPLARVQ